MGIHERIQEYYTALLQKEVGCGCRTAPSLTDVPSFGCGHPVAFAGLEAGSTWLGEGDMTVLNLGSPRLGRLVRLRGRSGARRGIP